jgi:phage/plasmid-like protein (TIGR03299 family)
MSELGKSIDPNVSMSDLASVYGYNWNVYAEQMYRINRHNEGPSFVPVENKYALVRDDLDIVLGSSSGDYQIFNNSQGFESLSFLIETGRMKMEVLGNVGRGRIVWGLLGLTEAEMSVSVGDSVKRYILFSWGHDGKTGLSFGITDLRRLCSNILRAAKNSVLSQLIRISHRGQVQQNVDEVLKAIDISTMEFRASVEDYKKMMNTGIYAEDVRKYVKTVLDLEESKDNKKATNIIDRATLLFANGIGNRGETVWDAFNSITEHLTHHAGRNVDNRLASTFWGQNSHILGRAHDEAMKMVA